MARLSYHLESEKTSRELRIALVTEAKAQLSRESLLSYAATPSEQEALKRLSKYFIPPSRIAFPLDDSFDLLKLLGTTGRLFFKGARIVVDPFSALDFYFLVEPMGQEQARIEGRWRLKTHSGSLPEAVFAADPPWMIDGGIVRPFQPQISPQWIRFALTAEPLLTGRALADFLERVEGEVELEWKGKLAAPSPLPLLKLADRHGGFADLWVDYGAYGTFPVHDPQKVSCRDLRQEKALEADLFETDFIRKQVGSSHYYCPLDKVAKSLTFLLEVGWTILDAQAHKVVRQTGLDLAASETDQRLLIRGTVRYENYEAKVQDVVGAFNRREHFIDIGPGAVALLDRDQWIQQGLDFSEEERVQDGISLPKSALGRLGSLLETASLRASDELKRKLAAAPSASQPVEVGDAFRGTLFPYQKEGLQWLSFLHEGGFGGLLADEMGLGKTVQILALFSRLKGQDKPILIVAPTSLLFNWQREIERFLPGFSVYRHEGKERLRASEDLEKKPLLLTSYALLRLDAALFAQLSYHMIILDEAQTIKNPDSQISEVCSSLKADCRLCISGTPIENRLDDLFSIFRFLQPDLLGDRASFQVEASRMDRIKRKVRPFLLRRKKEEVLLDLPPKLEQTIFVEMTEPQRALYETWLRQTRQKVSLEGASSLPMEILEAILRLRQLCAHPFLVEPGSPDEALAMSGKLDRLLSDVEEVVSEGHKVLIYSQFTSMLRLIESHIRRLGLRSVYLDGSTHNREEVVRTFQEDATVPIFLISLKAGGVGLNLTAADYVFLYDPWWNEAVEAQAIDRAHRLGRTGSVIARRYITALSIEEKILKLKTHKTHLSKAMLEFDASVDSVSLEDLLALLD
jgi:hypothetical protein